MPVSRITKSALISAALLGPVILFGTTPAVAQVQLFPSEPPSVDSPTVEAPNAPDAGAVPVPAMPEMPALSAPDGIAVEDLGGVDVEAVGALHADDTAFPVTLWSGLSRDSILALIDGVAGAGGYPVARDMVRRLLLSAASLPPKSGGDAPGKILDARVSALTRLGFTADAASLARVGSTSLSGADGSASGGKTGAVAQAEAQLAAFDLPAACGTAAGNRGVGSANAFWAKLLAFCQAVAGQTDQASLSAQTLADTGVEDPLYFSLMETLTLGLSAQTSGMTAKGPLHYALLRQTAAPVPDGTDDPLIRQLALQQDGGLDALEAAAVSGRISADRLAEAYRAEAFKASALDAPFEVLDKISPPAARALLLQVLDRWDIPALRAEAVAVALDRARGDGVLLAVAPVFAKASANIDPSADLLWFAETAARMFYVTGDLDRARRWHGLLRNALSISAEAGESDSRLWHLAVLSGEAGPALARAASGWREAVIAGAEDAAAGTMHADFLRAVVDAATGRTPLESDSGLRALAMAEGAVADRHAMGPIQARLLALAAGQKRVGETALLAVAGLEAAGTENPDPASLVTIVGALSDVGLMRESHRLALEMAVLLAPAPVPAQR